MKVIKLSKEESDKKTSYVFLVVKYFLIFILATLFSVELATQIVRLKNITLDKYSDIRVSLLMNMNHKINSELGNTTQEEVKEDRENINMLIKRIASEQKIDPIILIAITRKESGGGNKNFLYRFEPGVFASRTKADSKYSENERRMLSSSHGITQIMGYRAEPDCGVHWSKLYDNYVSLSCSAKIMKENMFRASKTISNPSQRLREAYRMYNGSGPRAEQYASDAMSVIGELLFDRMGVNV